MFSSRSLATAAKCVQSRIGTTLRTLSSTSVSRQIPSLYTLTDDEQMLKESVAKFAKEVVGPKVKEMDEKEMMDPAIMQGMFDQGLMGIEVDTEYDGAGCSFMSAILAVEEMAKVDPAVSASLDVHNTLVNTVSLIKQRLLKTGVTRHRKKST
jgi:short-chain 2-methylacyl-CoA dehydrogenase